jgi:2-polyprenyl-3-methyl-5-hydroxy-6-metoxy-1,4-benzoquinol methylase
MAGQEKSYDRLAPHFRAYSESRAAYLSAVDKLILRRIEKGARSLLDVGSGDGIRAVRLARACSISRLVLSDPSEEMARRCRRLEEVDEVWQVAAEDLPSTEESFDVITCLWNVIGLVADAAGRTEALRRMCSLLSPQGQIFFDVNNRYNAAAYGWLPITKRFIFDLLRPSDTNGDVTFDWHVDGEVIRSCGHVFRPAEIKNLIQAAGLKIADQHVIDYDTGRSRRFTFGGHLFYEIAKR